MTDISLPDNTLIEQWLAENYAIAKAEEQLKHRAYDELTINRYLSEYKRRLHVKKRAKGFVFAAAGAVLGFISCVLTVLNPVPELYYYILYGLTSVSIILIFIGLYFLFQ